MMAVASLVRKTAAGMLVLLLSLTAAQRASAQSDLAPVPPFEPPQLTPSLLDFATGKPIATGCKSLFTNPLLRAPFAGQPLDSAKGLAAAIKAEQLDAKNRIKAVKFLGTVDCVTYPDAPKMLVTVLQTDRVEAVRYEAAKSLKKMLSRGENLREKFCRYVGKSPKSRRAEACKGCCSDEILNALSQVAYVSDEQGCPIEPSYRVREMAIEAMEACPCYACPPTQYVDDGGQGVYVEPPPVEPAEPIEPTEPIEPVEPGEPVQQGPEVEADNTHYYPGASNGPQMAPTDVPARLSTQYNNGRNVQAYTQPQVVEKIKHDEPTVLRVTASNEVSTLKVLDDFCVVGLYSGRCEKADSRFASVYRERKYLFANEDAQQEFELHPERYAPMYAGFDPVIARNQGQAVEGQILRRYNGRLYSFVDEGNWRVFQANPLRYAVDQ